MAANGQGVNYKKSTHATFNYGTPNIFPLVITRTDAGNWNNYQNNDSDFHKVLNYMQGRGVEIYGIGEVESTQFTVLVNWNTLAQDATASENTGYPQVVSGDLDYLENEILNNLSIEVTVYHGKIVADRIDYNEC